MKKSVKREYYMKETGITLVALVVTIVVLLILAGITLVYVFGDNGVFSKAQESKNRTENAIENEKEYMNDIGNTIDKHTNGNEGGGNKPAGPTVSDSSTTSHTATTIDYTWEQISKIAEAIAKSTNVNSETMEVKANVDGTECTIGVGDIATVNYTTPATETTEAKIESRRVRVLGFKHDDLVNTSIYGSGTTASKAGISFEFLDFMTGYEFLPMFNDYPSYVGWGYCDMRGDLNGYTKDETTEIIADEQSGAIGGLGANLSNKDYIKQVKKQYIPNYTSSSTQTSYDYLWMLSCSEIVNQGCKTGYYGYAKMSEGLQYKYYQGVTEEWNSDCELRIKNTFAYQGNCYWWLRSPACLNSVTMCAVTNSGMVEGQNIGAPNSNYGVAPGFCI